ncbi:MAG: hypothetical protein ACODAG_04305 [Myxococcota bacterium]
MAPWHWILELPEPPGRHELALELELVRLGRRTVGWWRFSRLEGLSALDE